MSPRRLIGIVVVALVSAIGVASAAAYPVPGATYTGVASDGAQVQFTISSDGTLVTSYYLVGVQGNTCSLYTNGETPEWDGAPIGANAFDYEHAGSGLVASISFQGSFPGAQSASGTFSVHQDATSNSPACDTGTVSWTAMTTSKPSAPGTGPGGSGGHGSGSGPGGNGRTFVTRIRFRRLSRTHLGGRIGSPNLTCRARRKVYLWRGSHRIASTTSKANGSYTFARSAAVRGRRVRASSPARTISAGTCAAASSTFITA
jgi:hypothetical protein